MRIEAIVYVRGAQVIPLEFKVGEEHAHLLEPTETPFMTRLDIHLKTRMHGLYVLELEFEPHRYSSSSTYELAITAAVGTDCPSYRTISSYLTPVDNKQLLELRGKKT